MKQSNFSVKLFTQTLLSLLLTFVFTSAASAQDYSYRVARDGFVMGFFAGQTAAYDSDLSVIAAGYPDSGQHIGNHTSDVGDKTIFGWYKAGTELTFKLDVHNTGDTFMGFEDLLGGGDMDFNDNMAMFSNVIMMPVPEPSSIAMLLAGLGLLGFTRNAFLS